MTRALRAIKGLQVEIATTDADGVGRNLTSADLPLDAGTVHLFRRDRSESLKYSRSLSLWLQSNISRYDLVQVHSNWNFPVAAACRAARRKDIPYIIRPCGMLSNYSFQKSKWKKQVYWWLRERSNIEHAAGFHVTSLGEREEVTALGVKAPVSVIPLGISDDAWKTPVESNWLRDQLPHVGGRPLLLFLSRLHPKKGIVEFLLPAMTQLQSDAFLAIVGGEDEHASGFRKILEAEIRRLNLGDRVGLLGPLPPHRRWAAFDGADLFVLPSHSENFGIVVAEAMARGKPVVITTGVQCRDQVIAANSGSIVPPDPGKLAHSLDYWLENPRLRIAAGERGRKYIQEHLTWDSTARSLLKLYRRIDKADVVSTDAW